MKLVIAGGGTGGHLFPGIAVAEEFLARDAKNEVLFVGTEKGIEARLLPRLGYRLECISASGIKGMGPLAKLMSSARFLYGYSQSRKILKDFSPDIVMGVGGYSSAPLVLAARGLGIKRYIHEQNAMPGMTNKLLARFVNQVFISIEETRRFFPPDSTLFTGNPLRKEILGAVQREERDTGIGNKLQLLVFGGSAGAHRINMALIEALPHLEQLRERLEIRHQTGEKDCEEVREQYRRSGFVAEVVPFIDDMAAAYSWADLVICRAGATTVSEVTVCGKACIFIPYPFAADDHQRLNAEALQKKDAGMMLLERELSGERLANELVAIMAHPERIVQLGRNARSLAQFDAARIIVTKMTEGTGSTGETE
jgi:UDP-N-acetylglucosamine--N-acetylmuramyl-(pentapeptide) pyrophosphoryl-undecaprenol N-acetylglucosamine transferase